MYLEWRSCDGREEKWLAKEEGVVWRQIRSVYVEETEPREWKG